ncbi:MAG TPA: polyprenyl synthetase family protein [Firmicutes bacterium]|nr:polyprenyl synthetase family protein [Bacillota bacterium]
MTKKLDHLSFSMYLASLAEMVEAELNRLLPAEDERPEIMHRAMRYSACGGGKRLRAILVLEAAAICGASREKALPAGAAIEMLHAYSLIHDDLPCMDDDDYRRGKLSNHKKFGEGIAVLAGDALLTRTFAVLADLPALIGVSDATALAIIREVADAAGTAGLIGGQAVDLLAEGLAVDNTDNGQNVETLRYIHTRKTGALFRAALRTGAAIGGVLPPETRHLDQYSEYFGLAFQITDDILDVVGDQSKLGKKVGSDERLQKLTYPRLFGLEASRRMAEEAVEQALAALAPYGEAAGRLAELVVYIGERDR